MKQKGIFFMTGSVMIVLYIWTVVLGNDPLQPSIASKVLRFHVLANSDAACDQAVKEEVRDAVGLYLQPYLKDVDSLEETKLIIEKNLDGVVETAVETLRMHGYNYGVTAQIASIHFPEKTYGAYTFPKGEYEALQVVLGEGNGQNWWCVLYPNMCFKGAVFEVIEEDAKEALQEVLSPWEYADVFEEGKVDFRFKFLEYFTERG